jgi:hypothetical protein
MDSQYDNLKKLYDMTKDELDSLKQLVRDLLDCPSLNYAGPKALPIIEQLKALVTG